MMSGTFSCSERIEHENVLPTFAAIGNRNDVLGFFRCHHAKMSAVAHRAIDGLLRELSTKSGCTPGRPVISQRKIISCEVNKAGLVKM